MLAQRTRVNDKDDLQEWTAHSTHDIEHSRVYSPFRRDRAVLKEALLGAEERRGRYGPLYMLEMSMRVAMLERELKELREIVTKERSEAPVYITASKYPALVAGWDNDDDDVYNGL